MVEQVRPEIDEPDPRWPAVIAGIAAPMLVIAGGPTSPMPQAQVADLARTAQNGRLVTIPAGHLVHATEPEAFLEAATRFLNSPDETHAGARRNHPMGGPLVPRRVVSALPRGTSSEHHGRVTRSRIAPRDAVPAPPDA